MSLDAGEYVLGLSGLYHDSAAVLLAEGRILGAIQEERLSRLKGDSRFPILSIERLLQDNQISKEEISIVAWHEKHETKADRIWTTQIAEAPNGFAQFKTIPLLATQMNKPLKAIRNMGFKKQQFRNFFHHYSHAASAFLPSPYEQAAIAIVDGVGEWSSTSLSSGAGCAIKQIEQTKFPHSLGLFFATMTAYCGFKVNSGEYKLMGLAPFGLPRFKKLLLQNCIRLLEDGSFVLNLEFFGFTRSLKMWNNRLVNLLGFPPRKPETPVDQLYCDLAASTQEILNEAMLGICRRALRITSSKALCLAGGVALNCVANSFVRESLDINDIFVQPATGDAGAALGAAYLGLQTIRPEIRRSEIFALKDVFLGTRYGPKEIVASLKNAGLQWEDFSEDKDLYLKTIAKLLSSGMVVGWFSGRMEFGPRSLGARSILGDPRSAKMQSLLNLRIKFREGFRPFAPAVIDSEAHMWFATSQFSPYMLFTAPVIGFKPVSSSSSQTEPFSAQLSLAQANSPLPAVTHVDGSARFQTVMRDEPLYDLLRAFECETGVPVLINTSFNVRGEPIVESPWDAITCFLQTDMDALAIEPFLVIKRRGSLRIALEKPTAWGLD